MGRSHSELTKLACLNICDGFSHIMSHCYPTALAGIVHPHFLVLVAYLIILGAIQADLRESPRTVQVDYTLDRKSVV